MKLSKIKNSLSNISNNHNASIKTQYYQCENYIVIMLYLRVLHVRLR